MRAKRILSVAVALGALLALLPVPGAEGTSYPPAWYRCRDKRDNAIPVTLSVQGQPATGHVAFPRKKPTGLAVFGHGYGHTSLSWVNHMREAARHGLIAVTMDYRGLQVFPDDNGDGLPHSRGWNAMAGAEDLIAAAQLYQSLCKIQTVTILGVSMGGNMSGLAVAIAGERNITRADGTPLFDYWVDVEGATNMLETYAAARLAGGADQTAKNAHADIEAETGGTFEQKPEEYRKRTVVARVDDLKASGIAGAIVIHGLDDGLVPYNQSREITGLMREAGIPTEMITIGRRDEDSEQETTATGHAIGRANKDYVSPLAGHASEKSTTHIVMQTAFDRLWALMTGAPPVDRECAVNGQTPGPLARSCSN
jgi:hypothetical protein